LAWETTRRILGFLALANGALEPHLCGTSYAAFGELLFGLTARFDRLGEDDFVVRREEFMVCNVTKVGSQAVAYLGR